MHEDKGGNLGRITLIAAGVAILVCGLWYWLAPSSFPYPGAQEASGSYVLHFNETVQDARGIPYLGAVLYDAASGSYSYIATNDEGMVIPIGPTAFSSGTLYLAIRSGSEANELVLYDRLTLSPVRVVRNLPIGEVVASAVWSPDGKTFAYLVMGSETPSIVIETVDQSSSARSLGFDAPIGFSPDSSKLLVRGTAAPVIWNVNDGAVVQISGIGPVDEQTRFVLSPSGEYLVALSHGTIAWYAVDWHTGVVTSLDTIRVGSDTGETIFASGNTLLVWKAKNGLARAYAYKQGKGVKNTASFRLPLPEGARLLHVVSW